MDHSNRLTAALEKVTKSEMKSFHSTFVASNSSLNTKVCKDASNNCDNDNKKANRIGEAYTAGGADKIQPTEAKNIAASIGNSGDISLKQYSKVPSASTSRSTSERTLCP